MHILRVAELPQTLSASTVYLIKNQDDLDIVITGETAGIVAESKSSEKALASTLQALDLVVSGKLDASEKDAAGGVASLDEDGKVPSSQLPSHNHDASNINAGTLADARLPTSMSGKTLDSGELQFMNQKLHDNAASYELDLANGNYQRFAPTANGTIAFSGFTSGKLGIMLVKGVGLGSRTITWPTAVNWMKTDGTFTTTFAQTGIVLQTGSGVDFIQFWSDDGGATIYAKVFR